MGIVFVEYKVFPEKREAYLQWFKTLTMAETRLELYEGSDQPDLFVELWRDFGPDEYREFKKSRQESPESPWAELADFVPGGSAKVHIWYFQRSVR
ncbi:hypothetical protein FE783_26365 [Paenibacillus mesophilus]|uniref:hypothetical protein n=1 Tax=Paenibacillus mesophilus TaxID=2582849 RepID=UPI00110DF93C|nr:hypothetical protein [Paenibacillus mesophilus]TMV46486.1 hypothetical protein FE783_26365 [Paenibacillus mesophilus]